MNPDPMQTSSFRTKIKGKKRLLLLTLWIWGSPIMLCAQTAGKMADGLVTLRDVQGGWLFDITEFPNGLEPQVMEEDPPVIISRKHLWIKADSVWYMEYPYRYLGCGRIRIQRDSLFLGEQETAYAKLVKSNGTIGLEGVKTRFDNIAFWMPRTFHPDTVRLLIRKGINYAALVGKYELIEDYSPDYDASYSITFPIPLPRYFQVPNADSAKAIALRKSVMLPVNGKYRSFSIQNLAWTECSESWHNYDPVHFPNMRLEPGDWWQGLGFFTDFRRVAGPVSEQRMQQVVRSRDNLRLNFSNLTQVYAPLINRLGQVLDSLGYQADPFLLQQRPDYEEQVNIPPVQSGKYPYYILPPDSHRLVRLAKDPAAKEFDYLIYPERPVYTPLLAVKKITCYYFRAKGFVPRDGDIHDAMMEIWDMGSESGAREVEDFFATNVVEWMQDLGVMFEPCDGFRAGKYFYFLHSENHSWESDSLFTSIKKSLLK